MIQANREVISVLLDLVETCKDNEEGFHHAARLASTEQRSALFDGYARQAAEFAAQLQAEVRRLGGDAEKADIYERFAGPGWMAVVSKLTGEGEAAILAECECGVDATKKSYAAALEKGLPDEVRSLVERQHRKVKQMCDRIHALAGRHRSRAQALCRERQVLRSSEKGDRPPAAEGHAAEGQAAERPATERPASERPAAERPAAEGPVAERQAVDSVPLEPDVPDHSASPANTP